ncbi:MAG: Rne/Rng family ribonuclease [Proteobacteria bacterium]|nr:Rne/Rng family ribonuclease [Pseudomonadota bacterium]
MAEEVFINVAANETRVGVVEQGLLQEIFIERTDSQSTVGNIYKGRVVRILPGMQSAFVDFGEERAGFMHVTDLVDGHGVFDKKPDFEYPAIATLLHEGQELLVQVTKEPIGNKGARITTNLSMASRYLVYLPGSSHIGISQRIEDEDERERLRLILAEMQFEDEGFIVRTAAENASSEDILQDAGLLRTRWETVKQEAGKAHSPTILYRDLPLPLRVMRDIITSETVAIHVDHGDTHEIMHQFLSDYIPGKLSCLAMSDAEALFDIYQLEDQIEAALDRNVPLKSGGYLVIDQTEAMTTIDVNTGAFVGRKDLEDTIYRTNLEAANAISRQLRLRNIGGIVIIDFIDMVNEEHKRQVLRALEKGQQSDRVKCNITQISELGLVEMTRKRSYGSLLKMMCEPCPVCEGRGFLKSTESVCLEIFKQIQRMAGDVEGRQCLIMASQSVVDRLIDEEARNVRQLAEALCTDILYQVEPGYTQEQYDIVVSVLGQARPGKA